MAYYLTFTSGSTSYVDCGSDGSVDNLFTSKYTNGFTFEAWIKPNGYGGGPLGGYIFSKGNWSIYFDASGSSLVGWHNGTVQDADSKIPFVIDGYWHHIAATFHYNLSTGGDRKWHLFIDGIEGTYSIQDSLSGALSDAFSSLSMGIYFDGSIGWARAYNGTLYNSDFIAPSRCIIPTPDANTIGLWITEGSGTTTYNLGTATADGTISNATWNDQACASAVVNVYGVELGEEGGDSIVPMRGDRSAYDARIYPQLHTNDLDINTASIHHTLGTSGSQAAAGNHVHTPDPESANTVYAGPTSGSDPAEPTFRALVAADLGTGTPDGTKFLRDDMTWTASTGGSSSGHIIQSSGSTFAQRSKLNFTGSGVGIADDAINDATVITISAGSGSGHIIQNSGCSVIQRSILNFTGSGVTITDDPTSGCTVITISSGSSSGSGVSDIGEGHIEIMPFSYNSISGSGWSLASNNTAIYQTYNSHTTALETAEIIYKVYLQTGTYTLLVYGHTSSGAGITDFDINDVEVASFDWYQSGVTVFNVRNVQTGITISSAGLKDLKLRIDGKNASSSGYGALIGPIALWRTA